VIKPSIAKGRITAPPSKSYTHRGMVLGTLTHAHFTLKNPLLSDDTKATLDALLAFGAEVMLDGGNLDLWCEELRPAMRTIDARNSGTTLRLMTAVGALLPAKATLTGDSSLVKRPMGPLVEALKQLRAKCTYLGTRGCAPLTVEGAIDGKKARMAGDVSSQFVSALLIACCRKKEDTEVVVEGGLRSRPYVDITLQMLRDFGVDVEVRENTFSVPGNQSLSLETYTVPGDYSSSAFPLAAAAATGGDVTVSNLDPHSPQGDRAFLGHLRDFGAKVSVHGSSVRVTGRRLLGTTVDVRDTPDLFPVLAVLGALADGRTVLKGGENLRAKESDRIATTTAFLSAMGATVKATSDGCEILGGEKLRGAPVDTAGDHRILMAAAVAALASSGETRMEDDDSFAVSYPGFVRDMHQLGCRLEVRR